MRKQTAKLMLTPIGAPCPILLAQTLIFTHLYLTLLVGGILYLVILLAHLPLIVLLCIAYVHNSLISTPCHYI